MTEARVRTLVERDAELASLDALIAEAVEGSGRLVLIEGPAGVGKSRLLSESRERAADSMTVLTARASQLEREFPYGVVRQLFEGLIADDKRRKRIFSGAAEPARSVFGALSVPSSNAPPARARVRCSSRPRCGTSAARWRAPHRTTAPATSSTGAT